MIAMSVKDTEELEAIAREAYNRCHPDDTFADMKRRASFSREDHGLLGDWLRFAESQLSEPTKSLAVDTGIGRQA
jgi:hypothetical protein